MHIAHVADGGTFPLFTPFCAGLAFTLCLLVIPQVLENNVLHGRHFSEWLNELVPHPFVSVEFDCNLSFEQEILAVSEKNLI